MRKQPSPRKSYRDKGPLRRRLAYFVCMAIHGEHDFIELERGYVQEIIPITKLGPPLYRQVFKCNKIVCHDCGYET